MNWKGAANPKFKDGYWSGLDDYRNGRRAPVTLPKVSIQHDKVFSQKERKHYVSEIIGIIQDWRSTPFEHEGSSIAGIRTGLCMTGHSWIASHNEAETIVGEAFKRLGAKRPTYDEGQREYSIAPENCSWCGLAVPDELILSQRKTRFCSDVCARSAIRHRDIKTTADTKVAYRAAYETICRSKQSVQACEQCGKGFRPMFSGGRFCSHECSSEYNRVLECKNCPTCSKTFRPKSATIIFCSRACKDIAHRKLELAHCKGCAEPFRRRQSKTLFCSRACTDADKAKRQVVCQCVACGEAFIAKHPRATICSKKCENAVSRMKRKRAEVVIPFIPVHMLTAEVFDGWFARAA